MYGRSSLIVDLTLSRAISAEKDTFIRKTFSNAGTDLDRIKVHRVDVQ